MTRLDEARVGCDQCAPRCTEARQTTPERLGTFLRAVQADVRSGALALPARDRAAFMTLAGPPWWDDGFAFVLACTACAQRFSFNAETYHGSGGHWEPTSPWKPDLFLDIARTAVLAGADAICPYLRASPRAEAKADGSPVTEADLAADRAIAAVLAESGLEILSEESGQTLRTPGQYINTWVVDPLDGTRAFVAGLDEFTVNVALVRDGFPTVGAVHVPASGVTYGASAQGAWKEEPGTARRWIWARNLPHDHVTILTSRSYRGPAVERLVAAAQRDGVEARTVGMSSSLKMCLVAEGAADLYPRPGPTNAWDTAAAQAVLEAAGGFLGTWDGARLGVDVTAPLNPPVVAWGGGGMAEAWARWTGA